MEHEQIDQSDFIDRYLMGKLSAEESTSFEEHFVDCPRCLDRLQTTDRFLQGLRLAGVETETPTEPVRPRRTVRRFPPMFFHKPLAWAVAGMLIAAFAAAFFVAAYTRRLQTEVAQL
ncbi:MAG TPA: zf-HC2 domain-containing protein, partial [Blastocatellia bacterium]|nr:zf-HC2 domain-containing protein [Blastocatellia bacterium]